MTKNHLCKPMTQAESNKPFPNTIAVGTAGYDHRAWQGAFYDAELPAEWRFLHYCNQFRALLLPVEEARAWVGGARPELAVDSDDAFRFVVEIDDELLSDPRLDVALDALGARLQGVVYRCGAPSPALEALAAARALCVDPAGDDRAPALAAALGVSTVWRPPGESVPPAGPLMVARIGAAELVDMRRVLEALGAPAVSGERRAVFFDHLESAPEQARQCRIMAELMGL